MIFAGDSFRGKESPASAEIPCRAMRRHGIPHGNKICLRRKKPRVERKRDAALGYRTIREAAFFVYSARRAISARRRNRRDIHQSPARNTTEKTIRLRTADCPPNIKETISKRKSPMLPQLIAPIITSTSAILSSITISILPLSAAMIFCAAAPRRYTAKKGKTHHSTGLAASRVRRSTPPAGRFFREKSSAKKQ